MKRDVPFNVVRFNQITFVIFISDSFFNVDREMDDQLQVYKIHNCLITIIPYNEHPLEKLLETQKKKYLKGSVSSPILFDT